MRVAYGADASQFGDLRLPKGDGPFPVVVVIHGGFWYDRYDLSLMDDVSADLTRRGFATWNIEYRRVGDEGGGWPLTLLDTAEAVDYLTVLAGHHPLDLGKVITLGHSAGGHLALWVAARRRIAELGLAGSEKFLGREDDGSHPLQIHGAVSLAGVSDLQQMWQVRQENSPVVDFLGGTPSEVPERYAVASPDALLPLGLPQVLVHGTDDDRVPFDISDRYYQKAMELGDTVTLIELPGIEHFKVIQPNSEAWPTIAAAVEELFMTIEASAAN
ncbi:alpha/beta hydrolase [Alicyclobacillus curvatus]|nr:alpha/beta hydrolase [Alicyclobacillus curvatus]